MGGRRNWRKHSKVDISVATSFAVGRQRRGQKKAQQQAEAAGTRTIMGREGGGCVIPGIFGRDRIPRMSPSPRNGATNESVTRSFNNPSTQNNGRLLCPFASIHYFASDLDTRARALVESFHVQFVPIDRLANRRG